MYNLFYELVSLSGVRGQYYRVDTRLYYHTRPSRPVKGGLCKGVVWMCNPGNPVGRFPLSKPGWLPANLDRTLNEVFKVFSGAVVVRYGKKEPIDDIYLQIMNLFYVVNSDSKLAYKTWLPLKPSPPIEIIPPLANFVWLAWGSHGVVTSGMQTTLFPAAQKELNGRSLPYFYLDSAGMLHTKPTRTPITSFIHVLHPLRFMYRTPSTFVVAHMARFL